MALSTVLVARLRAVQAGKGFEQVWLLVAVGVFGLVGCRGQPQAEKAPDAELPAPRLESDTLVAPLYPASRQAQAPDFVVETLDGDLFSLSEQHGKVVVVNFWATWCAPCRQEMPDFVALQKALGPRGVQFVGVSLDKDADAHVRAFTERIGVNYPVGIDDGTVENLYGPLSIMPTTFVIDRAGNVRYYAPGMLTDEALRPALLDLLAEPS